jgi:hypothetical protein
MAATAEGGADSRAADRGTAEIPAARANCRSRNIREALDDGNLLQVRTMSAAESFPQMSNVHLTLTMEIHIDRIAAS